MAQPKRTGSLTSTMLFLAVLAGFLWQRQNIFDWWRLRNYQAPARVASLAADTTMSGYGQKLFYVNHPDIESNKTIFNQHCSVSEQTIVLGCFVSGQGIYLYDVTDSRLSGVEQVTAAHEMLHAAYDRFSRSDKDKLNAELLAVYNSSTDERLKSVIEQYRKRDSSVVPNELHSILGTEVRTLTPELETHYKQFFSDRAKIVGYAEQYQAVFTERKNQILKYDQQLTALKNQIDGLESQLTSTEQSLSADRKRLDSLLASGQYDSYNSGVASFNDKVKQYNSGVARDKQLVAQYNSVVSARNAIALEEQELVKAIDSHVSSQTTR
ncbi:MAG: hypothetical protein JWS12_678 [Candidatus Saccharibacteria bacterium]|nr:hypothetical protein [Candidatus Saccharibacteria bacterium]